MRSKKEWLKWFDSLDDNDLAKTIERRKNLLKTPATYDREILNFIENLQQEKIKKSKLLEKIEGFFNDRPFLRYGLSFASLIIILAISILPFLKINTLNNTIITYIENNAYLIDSKNNKVKIKVKDIVKEKNSVETEKESSAIVAIGKNAKISIKEDTSIIFNGLYKKKNIEKSDMLLNKGESHFVVNKLNSASTFKVETDTIIIEVAGTEFIVAVNNNKDTRVEVKEGRLLISPKINPEREIKSIKRIDKGYSTEINGIIKEKFILEKGQILEVSFDDFNESKNEILEITSLISKEILADKKDKRKIKDIKERLRPRLERIKKARNNIFKVKNKITENNDLNNKLEEEIKYITVKIGKIPGINFKEKNTSITTDGQFLYLTSDSNTALFCINPLRGKLVWSYKDSLLTDLTSPAINYKDKIILPTFNKVFILEKTGNIFNIIDIEKGTNYWAEAKIYGDKLFIPTSSDIYVYNNIAFNKLENLGKTLGQLYITIINKKLYFLDSNEQDLKMYNLESSSIEWTSNKLENRSFGTPLIIENQIYIADYKNNIYRFNLNEKSSVPEIIKFDAGAISNLIHCNKNIYFVANNGYLYSLDIDEFEKVDRIIEVDKEPNYNMYLTKKLLKDENDLYFSSNTGNLFHYDIQTKTGEFITIEANNKRIHLIGSPVKIKKDIYIIDAEANIYKITKIFD